MTDANGQDAGERYVIGITSEISHSPVKALTDGCEATWNMVKLMFQSIEMLISGEAGERRNSQRTKIWVR